MNAPESSVDPTAAASQTSSHSGVPHSNASESGVPGLSAGDSSVPADETTSSIGRSVLQSKWTVLAVLFVGTGALGIPLLWANKRFSTRERWFWAFAMVTYSLSMLTLFGWFVYWIKQRVFG